MPQNRVQKRRRRSKQTDQLNKKSNFTLIIAAVVIAVIAIAGVAYLMTQNSTPPPPVPPATPPATPTTTFTPPAPVSVDANGIATMASGLKYKDIVEGTGESPNPGKFVTVHYTGTLTNGKKFDSSLDRGQPYTFVIGKGKVIKGWDEGVMTMKVGGKRKLIIPPDLGYGSRGSGPDIPPNATLLFEVQLLGIR